MRLFEGILFLLCFLTTIIFFITKFRNSMAAKLIIFSTFIVFLIHYAVEGCRWQMVPLYALVILCVIITITNLIGIKVFNSFYDKKKLLGFTKALSIILIVLSAAAAYAFPVYKMKTPSGKYKIGTVTFDAVDPNRKETYGVNPNGNREIRVQLWYPSDNVKGCKRVPWLEDGKATADGVAAMAGLPKFLLSHTALVQSNSYKNAPISHKETVFPVVIISHGWTSCRSLHTDAAELLASNGYIVAAIDHTYSAAVTVFNNGQVEYYNRNALRTFTKNDQIILSDAPKLVNTYVGDIELTIDKLQEINTGKLNLGLTGKVDLSKIGLLGHSTGGGADVATAQKDNRVKAIMGLDAWVEPLKEEDAKLGLHVPALFLRSEQWMNDENNKNLYSLINNTTSYRELYQINGMIHQDFTMVYMYSPLSKYVGFTGKLDGWKGAEIQQDFILNYFNKYLLNKSDAKDAKAVAEKYKDVQKIK